MDLEWCIDKGRIDLLKAEIDDCFLSRRVFYSTKTNISAIMQVSYLARWERE